MGHIMIFGREGAYNHLKRYLQISTTNVLIVSRKILKIHKIEYLEIITKFLEEQLKIDMKL